MAYLNNPDAVLDEVVDLDQPEDKLFACIVGVIRTIVGEQWSTASSESVDITKLTGGITNILFMAVNKVTGAKVIVRIYGLGTSEFIDRNSENVVFATLSKLNFGPTFYGLFSNGRLEGYLPALALQLEEMGDSSIVPAIASAVAKLHSFEVDAIKKVRWLWTKIETFMTLAESATIFYVMLMFTISSFSFYCSCHFDTLPAFTLDAVCKIEGKDADKAATASTAATSAAVCDTIVKMRGEAVWLERYLQERELEYTNSSNCSNCSNCSNSNEQQQQQRQRGRRYGMSECLCHNDLLSGNILLRNQQLVEAEEALSTAVGLGQHSQDLEKNKEDSLPPPVAVAVAVAVHIIDYEYAAYNYRAFDIANHFSGTHRIA